MMTDELQSKEALRQDNADQQIYVVQLQSKAIKRVPSNIWEDWHWVKIALFRIIHL